MKVSCLLALFSVTSFFCYGQRSFTFGAKLGYGTSALPMDALAKFDGSSTSLHSGATFCTGVTGRYVIGDRIGIGSGLWFNHYSYYWRDDFRKTDIFWKRAAAFEILDIQVPLIVHYQTSLPRHPFVFLIFGAGTSFDWLNSFSHPGTAYPIRPGAFQNAICTISMGRERPKGNMFEISVELQYSLKQFLMAHYSSANSEFNVYTRLNLISLNFSYFFLKKRVNAKTT